MGKKVNHEKQRSSYTPNKVYASNGTDITDEEKEAYEATKLANKSKAPMRVEEIDERDYNASLFNLSESLTYIKLLNNNIIVRLFLRPKTKGGLIYTKTISKVDLSDPSSIKYEKDESESASAIHRGVVVKLGESCSDLFKSSIKPGDIVDLVMSVNPNNYMLLIDKENLTFDNYYSLPETYIHYVWTKDTKDYQKLNSTP